MMADKNNIFDIEDDDDFEEKIWFRDYECPECGNVEEDVKCQGKYAPIRFCTICGCMMN